MPISATFKDDDGAPVKIWTDDVEASALAQLQDHQSDLVEVVAELKQILCVKG
jgi:hypothetical protein